ncbi:gliding motility-associated C-terminal domain-containing protein [Flavobacteriaceae bacterium]|nr:gliding motility-associated C-terminal domain-containing protein [Flavobacteriaceae bacterium]
MIKRLLTSRKYLVLGVLLMLSFSDSFAQDVRLRFNARGFITTPSSGSSDEQFCTSATSNLRFVISNDGTVPVTLTATSVIVTLTVSGNTFLDGSTVATNVFDGSGGNPATIPATGSSGIFTWPSALQFANSGVTTVAVSVAVSGTTEGGAGFADNSTSYQITVLPNPVTPVLTSNFGTGTINICQGDTVVFSTTVDSAEEYEFWRTNVGQPPVLLSPKQSSNSLSTNGLNDGDVITVVSYFTTGNCGRNGTSPITVNVFSVPNGSIASNTVACYGDTVAFTASDLNGNLNPLFEFYEGTNLVQASSTTSVYTSNPVLADNFSVTVRTWNSATATLCYDEDTINIRLNSVTGTNQISNTATAVCAGVAPPTFNSDQVFTPERFAEGATLVHQWQSREIGGTFGDISIAATNTFYTPSALTTTTAFRRLSYAKFLGVQCTTSIASATSNIVTLTFAPSPSPSLTSNATNLTLCIGDDLALDGSSSTGASSYQFYKNATPVPSFNPTSTSTLTIGSATLLDGDIITLRTYTDASGTGCFSEISFTLRINSLTGANTIGSSVNDCFGDVPDPLTSISTPTIDRFLDGSGAVLSYQWETRTGTDPFGEIASPAGRNETYTPTAIVSTTRVFRRKIISTFNGLECTSFSNEITITVDPAPTANLVSVNTACVSDTVLFTASGGDLYEFFRNGISVSAGVTTATNTITFSDLINLERVNVEVTDSAGCKALSDTVTMTMLTVPAAAISSGVALDIVCSGEYPTFTAGPVVAGYTYEFFVNNSPQTTGVSGNSFDSNAVSNTIVLGTSNVISVRVSNGASCTDTASLTLFVNSLTGANSISASQTVCAGGTPLQLIGLSNPSADSAVATIGYQWQNRETGTTFNDINGATSADYSPTAIGTTTFYRRLVYAGLNTIVCPGSEAIATSNVVTITVDTNAVPVIGFTSGLPSNVLCKGSSVTFDASATTGAASFTFYIQNIEIRGLSAVNTYTPPPAVLGALNDFDVIRVRANSSVGTSCYAEQSIVLRINEQSNNNNIATSQATVCLGSLPALLTGPVVTGSSTAVISYQWQSKTSTSTFIDIDFATAQNFQPSALVTTTVFRRNVISTLLSATCIESSNLVTITGVDEANPTISFQRVGPLGPIPLTFCTGDSISVQATSSLAGSSYAFSVNGGAVLLTNNTGVFTPTNFAPWNLPLGSMASGDTIDVLISPGGCSVTSSLTLIENRITAVALTTTATTICIGDLPPVLRAPVSTSSGTLRYRFEQSIDSGVSWSGITTQTTSVYTPTTGIVTTTRYRIVTLSSLNGVDCEQPSPNEVEITVDIPPVGTLSALSVDTGNTAVASSTLIVCPGEEVRFTAGGVGGTPSFAFFKGGVEVQARSTSAVYTTTALVTNDFITAAVYTTATGGCSSTTERIRIQNSATPAITFGRAGGLGLTYCTGDAVTLQASSTLAGSTYSFSVDGGATLLTNNTGVFTPTAFLAWTGRAIGVDRIDVLVSQAGGCSVTSSLTLIENRITAVALTTTATTICIGDLPPVLRAPVSTSSGTLRYRFEQSIDSGVSWSGITTQTTSVYTPTTGIVTTTRYRIVTLSSLNGVDCEQPSPNEVEITVDIPPVGTLSALSVDTGNTAVASSTLIVCPGEEVRFTAGGVGGTPSFAFFKGGVEVQARSTSAVYTTTALVTNDFITAAVYTTATGGCSSTTERIRIQNSATPAITFERAGGLGLTYCTGDAVTLQASSTLAGSTYTFRVNGGVVTNTTTGIFTPTDFAAWNTRGATGNTIEVVVTIAGGCSVTSSLTLIENVITNGTGVLPTTASTTICAGTLSSIITAPASTASGTTPIYTWFESPDNSSDASYIPIGGTNSTSLAPRVINARTFFKRRTQSSLNGVNCSVFTAPIEIRATNVIAGLRGSFDANVTFVTATATLTSCEFSPVVFTGTGGLSYSFTVNGIEMQARGPGVRNTYTTTGLANGQVVRVIAYDQLPGITACEDISDPITMNVIDSPVVDLTSSDNDNTFCVGDVITYNATSNLDTAAVSPTYTFFVNATQWKTGTSAVFTPTNFIPLADGDVIRVTVSSTSTPSCQSSDSITVIENTITADGIITHPSPIICNGSIPDPFISVAAATGVGTITYQWESRTSGTAFSPISTATSAVYTPTSIQSTDTFFRRKATSELNTTECVVYSNVVSITMASPLFGGSITPAAREVCSGTRPPMITVTGGTLMAPGITFQWQESLDGLLYTDIPTATGQNYTPPILNTRRFYRRIVQRNGGGPPASCQSESTIIRIEVNLLDAGALDPSAAQDYCFGSQPPRIISSTIGGVAQDATSSTGTITYQWQRFIPLGIWTPIPGATENYYDPPSLIETTFFRRQAISSTASSVCTSNTNSVRVGIIPEINTGTALGDSEICTILEDADLPGPLALTGAAALTTSVTYQWQRSINQSSWEDIPGEQTGSLVFSRATPAWLPIAPATYYRAVVKYIGDPVPAAQEQAKILLTPRIPAVAMAAGGYSITVNGNANTVTTTAASSTDDLGASLATKITNDDPHVNASYDPLTNIISIVPLVAGTYNVASSSLLTDSCLATVLPAGASIDMNVSVMGDDGAGNSSCQSYSNVVTIEVAEQPALKREDGGALFPIEVCRGDAISPVTFSFSGPVDEIVIRNLDAGLTPTITGTGTVIGPFDVGGLGFTGWYRLTGMTTSTFSIAGNVLNTTNFDIITVLEAGSSCTPVNETFTMIVTPNPETPDFVRMGVNAPGYEILSSAMSSSASITAITPVRWYNNTVCQDRLPGTITTPTEFFTCYVDNTFNQLFNEFEWDVSPPSAGNMVDNNFREVTIQLRTISAPAVGETYTVTVTTGFTTTAYTTTTSLATQTTDQIGIDLANRISASTEYAAIYNAILDQIVIEARRAAETYTVQMSPTGLGQSTQFFNQRFGDITKSGTMIWDPSHSGSTIIRVRAKGCNSSTSSWTSVIVDVVKEQIPVLVVSDLYPPLVLDVETCGGGSTGSIPVCEVDALTLPTQFFTSSINATPSNDYGSLQWDIANITPGGTVTPPGTIDQATGIITWNPGWWGTFDLKVRPVNCEVPSTFGNWSSTTVSIGPVSGPPTINTLTPLPQCPIPAAGFTTTFFSNQEVNWYVNSRVGLATTTTFVNTGTLQLNPLANNDLLLDFLPGFSGNVIITAESATCPGSTVNYIVQIPGPPTIALTSAPGTDFQRGATSVCVGTAINTITYDISGAADLVSTIGLPAGITSVLSITPQSVNMTLGVVAANPFTVGQLYTVNIDNIVYGYTTVLGDGVNEVGAGLAANINLNTTNFDATYAANVLSVDVSATGKRGDAYIIAPSTPVNNSFSIAAPLVTVLQKVLTISGTANAGVTAGSYTYTVTTQPPAAGCAVATATGIIEIDEPATIAFASGRADNTGLNSVCIGASFTAPITLATLRFSNATGLVRNPLTPFPAGLSLSMSASGSFDEYEIVGTITEAVLVPTTFSVTIDTFGASCSDTSIQIDIEVTPNAEITPVNTATVSQVICSQEAIIPIRFEVFNPAFGIGTTAASVFPDGVTGALFQQNQVSEFEVENLGWPAGTTANNTDTFSFNIANIVYTYTVTNSLNTVQLADRLAPWLTTQLPEADFKVIHTALTPTIQIQAVNAGFAFNVVSSESSSLTISDTEIIDPPSYYEISGTPSVTLVAPADYVYVLTTAGPGCTGSTTMSGTITVQPNTYATYQSGDANPVICDNEVIGDIVYRTVGATLIAVVTPTTPDWVNIAFDPIAQEITISTPVAPSQNVSVTTVYNYEVNLIGSIFFCTATPSAIRGTITVSPLDQITHVITSGAQNQDICVDGMPAPNFAIDPIEYQLSGGATDATVTGLPPGITANLTASNTIRISGTATAIPSDTFTYNYVLVTTPASCASATIGGAITVFSKPEFTLVTTSTSANQTGINSVCDATPIQTIIYEHSSTIPITTQVNFTWVGSNTLDSLGVTAIVSGTNQFVISGTPTTNVTQTTIYNYQIETVGSNCTPELVLTGSIEINPIDTLTLISSPTSVNQFVCIGDQDNPITAGTDSYVPIEYQLGGGATNVTVVGLPLGLNYSITPSNTLVISGAINAAATPTLYNYLITTTGDCTNVTAVGSIDVSALPTLTLNSSVTSANQTGLNNVCDATPIETIVYQLGGGATNFDFSWTGTLSNTIAASGLTFTSSGTTEFVISGTPTTAVTQTSIFEYQIATMGSNCIPEIVLTGRIQIEPNQTIDLISAAATENQIVCVNNQINPLSPVTSVFAPIEYQLGGSAIGATITGLPPGIGFSKTASNTILITGSATASATSIASPTVIYNYVINTFGDCDAAPPITGSITVNSLPVLRLMTASSTANQTGPLGAICVDTPIQDILYRFEGGATSVNFNWTSPGPLSGLTATNSGTNEFIISGAPSVTLTTTTIFNYEIITSSSNCAPEITLTGSIEVIPEDLIVLTSAVGTDNQNVCVSGLPVGKALTDIVYELRNGARTAIVTGLPPGIGYSINASRTLTIQGAAQASSSLSSLTITNYVYTITSSGCSPDVVNGTISVTPPPEMVLVSGLENQPPVCNNTPITSVDYVFNPAAGALPTVSWPNGKPNGVTESFGGLTLNRVSIQGTPNVTVTSTTIYPYIITYAAVCAPDVVHSGSIGVIPTPVIDDAYIIANDVTNVTCFGGNDGSIIIPDATLPAYERRISGGLLSVKQIDEITLTGTPTIGDIISVSFGGKTYTYTVKASAFLSLIPEDFRVISNELAAVINNAVPPNESYATAVPNGTPLVGGLRLTADVGGIALNTSVNVAQTTSVSNTLATTRDNRALNYSYSWTGPGGFTSSNLSIFNLSAGDYFLTVDLNGCAETSAPLTVTEPPELVIAINACGGTTGSFEATITGGTPPYNLILEDDNGVQIGPTVVTNGGKVYTGLAVGDDYVLEVTDQTCLLAVREAIEIPTQLLFAHWDLNDGVTDSYCSTSTIGNGSIELTRPVSNTFESAFSGGSNVYSYQWTSSASSATIATTPNIYNLVADIYTVTITDLVLGCTDTKSFTVGGYPPLEFNPSLVGGLQLNTAGVVSSTGVATSTADYVYFLGCNGDNDAAFSFNATGGNSNYKIISRVPTGAATNVFAGTINITNGVAGFYTFLLEDKGPNEIICSVFKTVQVINPSKMLLTEDTALRVNPVCFGELGYLEFNIAGGAPNQGPYTVTLNGGQLSYTTLSAGDRRVIFADIDTSLVSTIAPSVEIEDAYGCVAPEPSLINTITFNVTQELVFDTTVTDIDCSVPIPAGSVIFNETGPGTFIDPSSVQIRIYSNPTIVPAINLFPVWGTNPAISSPIQLSEPGVYFYEITDGSTISCPAITGFFEIGVVGNTAPLVITNIDVTQVGCDNATSIIALDIQNIQPPLNINWFEYRATTRTGTMVVPDRAGTGTTTIATTTLNWDELPDFKQNATVSNLPEGIYRAEVSDGRSGNCGGILRTRDILLQESSIQIVNFRTIENDPAFCDNYGTGFTSDVLFSISENLNRNLGSNSFEITLLSKSGTVITNPTAWNLPKPQGFVYRYPNLPADQYTLSVTESLPPSSTLTACSEVYFFDIQDYLPITYIGQTVFETDICTGLVDEIEALASGGVPFIVNGLASYQFEWTYTPIDPTQSPSQFFGQTLTDVPAGNYCVKITDKNGCSYDSCDTTSGATPLSIIVDDVVIPFSVTGNLSDPTDPSVQVKSLSPDCSSGGLDGRIGVVLSGGLLPYTINWFVEDPTSLTNAANPGYRVLPGSENRTSLDGLLPGNYKMVVTSLNPAATADPDCEVEFKDNDYLYYDEIIQVTPNRELYIIDGPFVDEDLCSGNYGRLEVEVFDNNNGNLSFYYNGILIPSSDVIRLNNYSWSIAIVNAIESADFKIVNEEGCWITTQINRGIGEPNFTYTSPNFQASSNILAREEVTFTNASTDPYVVSEWIFGDNTPPILVETSTTSITPVRHAYGVSGTYFATLRIYNDIGCSEEVTEPIVVGKGYSVMVPNVFTPNNDLVNDNFRPLFSGFSNMTFSVYDYRGNVIFNEFVEEADLTNIRGISIVGWDGSLAPYSPYYIFTASGVLLDGETVVEESGTFIIIN